MATVGESTDGEALILFGTGEAAEAAAQTQVADEAGLELERQDILAAQGPVLHMACAMCLFATLLCIMTVASIGLLVYLAYEYSKHSTDNCDVPLQLWVQVVSLTALFNLACNQHDRYGTLGARIFCGWSFDPENPERPPFRVQFYNMLIPSFTALWNCVGLYWVSKAHEPRDGFHPGGNSTVALPEEKISRCTEVAAGLLSAVRAYVATQLQQLLVAGFNLLYSTFILIGVAGLSQMLYFLARRGFFRVSDAAPPGSLERNTEEVGLDDPAIVDHPQCPICLEDFGENEVLVKMKACGHVFHKEHLQDWLQMHRTCPLCRYDLGRRSSA